MKDLNLYTWIALILVIVGGVNWLLIGLFDANLISSIFGSGFMLGRLIYILIGLGALYLCYLIYLEKFKKPTV